MEDQCADGSSEESLLVYIRLFEKPPSFVLNCLPFNRNTSSSLLELEHSPWSIASAFDSTREDVRVRRCGQIEWTNALAQLPF